MAYWLRNLTLGCIVVLALLLRVYALDRLPVHLAIDEIANGYNAYTILSEAKDEWGVRLPFTFKSYDDYKPPVHIYAIVPFLAVFGNSELSVRLPIAIIGGLSVILIYVLAKRLKLGYSTALFTSFLLAISPWHIHFSRGTFEAVLALFFALGGVAAFYLWIDKKGLNMAALSATSFSLAVWSYHAQRLFVPLFVVFLFYIHRKSLLRLEFRTSLRSFIATATLFAVPLLHLATTTPAISTRAAATSILRDSILKSQLHQEFYANIGEQIFDNDIYLILQHWAGQYFGYFDISFLFWDGLELTLAGLPDMGLMYTPDLLLFALGIFAIVTTKNKRLRQLAIGWGLLGPLPASVTMNPQHPLRALVWLPFFILTIGAGFELLWRSKHKLSKLVLVGYFGVLCLNAFYFTDIYTKQSPRLMSEFWQYGYKEIALWACEHEGEYDNIYVSEAFGDFTQITGSPQHYLGFYCKRDYLEFLRDPSVPGITIKRPFFPQDLKEHPNSVFIAAPWDFPIDKIDKERIIKRQYFLNGKLSFIYVETDKR